MGNESQQNENSENSKSNLTNVSPKKIGDLLSNSELRAIELSRKGIFACPKYIDLFINIDDTLMK